MVHKRGIFCVVLKISYTHAFQNSLRKKSHLWIPFPINFLKYSLRNRKEEERSVATQHNLHFILMGFEPSQMMLVGSSVLAMFSRDVETVPVF